jgi:hypothetical protein
MKLNNDEAIINGIIYIPIMAGMDKSESDGITAE